MCGIAGIVGPAASARVPVIAGMNAIQRHRGPDDEGTFADRGVALGLVRLAILDLSAGGHQPMTTPDGRHTIVHNGEVYNYIELREALEETGPFKTDTDTEVILRAYATWGESCVERFIGMFGFAIWDRQAGVLFCARDRFGIKPFYYVEHDGHFIFASEIKTILESGVPRRPCLPVIYDYLARGCYEHGPETFFEGVRRLLPGHCLRVRPGQAPSIRRYYFLADRVQARGSESEDSAAARLGELLEDAVKLRLRADVKVGVSLSGGLDSSTLLALVDRMAGGPNRIEAFSAIYPEPRYSERPWIEVMAGATRRRVNFSLMGPEEFWRSLEAMTWYADEPFGGVATASWVGLYQAMVERGATVLLDGNGLDDILAGYRSQHMTYLASRFREGEFEVFGREFEAYLRCWQIDWRQGFRDLHSATTENAGAKAVDGSDPVRPECLTREFAAMATPPPEFPRPFGSPLRDQLYQGLVYTKIPRALRFKDRASMAFSRELRVPFLDHRLVEYCFGLPEHYLIRDGLTKYLLRRAMQGLVPDDVRLAPKRSVPTPQREWLASPLRERIEEILDSGSFTSRGLVDPRAAKREYARYCTGERTNSFYVWQWINLELWFRRFIDPPRLEPPSSSWPRYPLEAVHV